MKFDLKFYFLPFNKIVLGCVILQWMVERPPWDLQVSNLTVFAYF